MRKYYDYPGAPTPEERRRLRATKLLELVCAGLFTIATIIFLGWMLVYFG